MSGSDNSEDGRTYGVVINEEEQYSIWLLDRETPPGWSLVGKTGSKADCLEHIEKAWTDMRPLSLRKWMDEQADRDHHAAGNGRLS
jgi:MbtH protein